MTTLLITHTITGPLEEWLATFSSFDEVRTAAGVTAVQVRHGVDDPASLAIDLEFATADEARSFLSFLETKVWPDSPHLGGVTPVSRILEPLSVSA